MGQFDSIWKLLLFFLLVGAGCVVCGYFIGTAQTIKPLSIGFIFFIVVLTFSKDHWAYYFLFLLFPFRVLLYHFYEDQVIAALVRDGILMLLVMKLFWDVALARDQFLPSPIGLPIYAFVAYSTSYLLATEKGFLALLDFRSKLLYISVFFLTVHYVNSRTRLTNVIYLLVGVGFFVSLLGVLQQLIGVEQLAAWGLKPRIGFADTGLYLVAQEHLFSNAIVGGLIPGAKLSMFFALCYLHLRKKIPLLLIIALISIVGTIFTFSRAAFITMVAGIFWLSIFTKWKKLVLVTMIGFVLFFTFTTGWVYDRFEDIFHPFTNTSFAGRIYSYIRAVEGFKHFAFGSGFGKIGGALKSWDTDATETDTYYVTIFMTIGLPGFLIFMWIGATLFIKGFLTIIHLKTPFYKLTAIAAYTYVCQQYIAIITIDSFHTLPTAFYFWVCAGILFSLERLDDQEVAETVRENEVTDPGNLIPVTLPS